MYLWERRSRLAVMTTSASTALVFVGHLGGAIRGPEGAPPVPAHRGASPRMDAGELAVIVGPSGPGRSAAEHPGAGLGSIGGGSKHLIGSAVMASGRKKVAAARSDCPVFLSDPDDLFPLLTAGQYGWLARLIIDSWSSRSATEAVGLGEHGRLLPGFLPGGDVQVTGVRGFV